jgi:hypothetical protein
MKTKNPATKKATKKNAPVNISLDAAPAATVISESTQGNIAPAQKKEKIMTLEFTHAPGARKDPRYVIFEFADGRPGSIQFLRSAFPGEPTSEVGIPSTVSITGEFAEKAAPKPKESAEERKARLANAPKLTPAQKLARAEEKVARLRAKVAEATAEPLPA